MGHGMARVTRSSTLGSGHRERNLILGDVFENGGGGVVQNVTPLSAPISAGMSDSDRSHVL